MEYQSLESTNRCALDWITSKIRPDAQPALPPEGTVILAREQRAGRGQFGTTWYAEPGAGLTMSLILYPGFVQAASAFQLSVALSLGVLDALKEEIREDWQLKWPNDVYIRQRKAGGVLIENGLAGKHLSYAVFGLGLNVNERSFPAELPRAVSLRQLDGRERSIRTLALKLCEHLEGRYEQLRQGAWSALKRQYLQVLLGYGERGLFLSLGEQFEGVIAGLEDSGELALECQGRLRRFRFKEIEQLIGERSL